jgi:putative transcriptional regulator
MPDSLIGNLLVASSTIQEPIFHRGVCLIVHQDESGTIGVMLNRPMQPLPEDLLRLLSEQSSQGRNRFADEQKTEAEQALANATNSMGTVHFGGPLSGPVVAIHGSSQLAEAETGSGIYVAAQKQHLEALVRNRPSPYRLIVGHVGWENDQLADELLQGMWHIAPATTDAVFSSDQDMWPTLVRRATARSVANWIGIPDVPAASLLN